MKIPCPLGGKTTYTIKSDQGEIPFPKIDADGKGKGVPTEKGGRGLSDGKTGKGKKTLGTAPETRKKKSHRGDGGKGRGRYQGGKVNETNKKGKTQSSVKGKQSKYRFRGKEGRGIGRLKGKGGAKPRKDLLFLGKKKKSLWGARKGNFKDGLKKKGSASGVLGKNGYR